MCWWWSSHAVISPHKNRLIGLKGIKAPLIALQPLPIGMRWVLFSIGDVITVCLRCRGRTGIGPNSHFIEGKRQNHLTGLEPNFRRNTFNPLPLKLKCMFVLHILIHTMMKWCGLHILKWVNQVYTTEVGPHVDYLLQTAFQGTIDYNMLIQWKSFPLSLIPWRPLARHNFTGPGEADIMVE